MLRHFLSILLLSLLWSGKIVGQPGSFLVKGTVFDAVAKSVLSRTNITVSNASSSEKPKTLMTDANGYFSLSLPAGTYKLVASHTGFEVYDTSFELKNNDLTLPNCLLRQAARTLKTVTVDAKKPFITLSAGKVNMNVAESAVGAGSNTWELLQLAPGVTALEDGTITLNGKGVVVYLDGRPSYLSGEQLKNLLISLQASTVDKIELIRNPSSRYDAAGEAIISIKTKKSNKKGFNGTYTASAGASALFRWNTGIDLNYLKNKTNLYGGFDYSHNGNQYNPLNERTSHLGNYLYYITETEEEKRKRDNYSFKGGLDYSPSKFTTMGVSVKGFANHRYRIVNGLTSIGQLKNSPDSTIHTLTTGNAVFSSPALNLYYKTSFDSSRKEVVINADYYRYDQQWNDQYSISFKDRNGADYKSGEQRKDNSPTIIDILAFTTDYTRQLKNMKWEYGIKTSFIKTDNDVQWENNWGSGWVNDPLRSNHFIYQENINAAYTGISLVKKKYEFNAALRVEQTNTKGHSLTINNQFSRHYFGWFPSINLATKLDKKNDLTFSYRRSIKRPYYSYTNPFLLYQGQLNYFQGNPGMKPAYSSSFEISHSYKNIVITTFSYTSIKDLIAVFYRQDDSSKIITRYYDNYKYGRSLSLDVAFSKFIKPWWMTNTTFSVYTTWADFNQVSASGNSTWVPSFSSSNTITLKKTGVKLEVSGTYRPAYSDGYYQYKATGGLNLGVQKDILKKKASLKIGVRDVFKTNIFSYTAQYANVDIYTSPYYDSRSMQLTFSYRFGKQFINKNKNRKSSIESETNRIN